MWSQVPRLFFDRVDDALSSRVIPIDPETNHTYHYWHAFVFGVEVGQVHGFRSYGPFESARGLRFDPSKLLLDPMAAPLPSQETTAARWRAGTATTRVTGSAEVRQLPKQMMHCVMNVFLLSWMLSAISSWLQKCLIERSQKLAARDEEHDDCLRSLPR